MGLRIPENLAQFEKFLVEAGDKLVVVDFHATWCGPCKVIAPVFKKLSDDNPEVMFVKVDVDENEEIAAKYNVSCMPTFVFIKNGNKVDEFSGANEKLLGDKLVQYGKK